MIGSCVVHPAPSVLPWPPGQPAIPLVPGGIPHTPGWVCAGPWSDGFDPELERLRHLEREAAREREKAAIRERLRRMGVPEDRIVGSPSAPCPRIAPPHRTGALPSLDDIIQTASKKRSGR